MATKKAKNKGGRPTKYSANYVPKLAVLMAGKSMIDKDMAEYLGIAESTFHKWKTDHPEFAEALRKGKEDPDDAMEAALYKSGIGYTFDEVTQDRKNVQDPKFPDDPTKTVEVVVRTHLVRRHYPGAVAAQFIWLKNRRPNKWRDRHEIEIDFEDSPLATFAAAMQDFRLADDDENRITD